VHIYVLGLWLLRPVCIVVQYCTGHIYVCLGECYRSGVMMMTQYSLVYREDRPVNEWE